MASIGAGHPSKSDPVKIGDSMPTLRVLPIVRRRWIWLVLALILAGVGGAGGFLVTSPTYSSSAQLLLLPSVDSLKGNAPPNPFLALSQSLQETAAVVSTRVTSAQTVAVLASTGRIATYTVAPDLTINAPVVKIQATDASAAVAQSTMQRVVDRFSSELDTMQQQAGAPARSRIQVTAIAQSPVADKVLKTMIRNAIVLGMLGLLAGLVPVLVLERRALQRAARKQSEVGLGGDTDFFAAAFTVRPDEVEPATVVSRDAPEPVVAQVDESPQSRSPFPRRTNSYAGRNQPTGSASSVSDKPRI